jgi:hypothetical protein
MGINTAIITKIPERCRDTSVDPIPEKPYYRYISAADRS